MKRGFVYGSLTGFALMSVALGPIVAGRRIPVSILWLCMPGTMCAPDALVNRVMDGVLTSPEAVPWMLVGNTLAYGVFGVVLERWVRARWARLPMPGCCHNCSYDLTGNISGVCPECGTVIEKPETEEPGRRDTEG